MSYSDFLARKASRVEQPGRVITLDDVNPTLHPWQAELVQWAVRTSRAAIWADHHDGGWIDGDGLCPVWYGIRETDTLNVRVAREDADERHIAPLQLGFIERCIRLWSNPDETILTPFGGIGSELYVAVKLGRKAIGCELKPSYWRTAVDNLTRLEADMSAPSLFDLEAG